MGKAAGEEMRQDLPMERARAEIPDPAVLL